MSGDSLIPQFKLSVQLPKRLLEQLAGHRRLAVSCIVCRQGADVPKAWRPQRLSYNEGGSFLVLVVFCRSHDSDMLFAPLATCTLGQKLEKQSSVIGVEDVMRRVAMQVVLRDFTFPLSRLHFLPDTAQ